MGRVWHRVLSLVLTMVLTFPCGVSGQGFVKRVTDFYKRCNEIDTNFVEKRKFSFKVQANYTQTQETYRMQTSGGQELHFRSPILHKVGPALGFECLGGGFGFSLNTSMIDDGSGNMEKAVKREWGFNCYTPMLIIDGFYRQTGDDFRITKCYMPYCPYISTGLEEGDLDNYSLVKTARLGINMFYVFNHHRYSSQAAMTSACVQLRSAGSPLVGIGYSHSKMRNAFNNLFCMAEMYILMSGDPESLPYSFDPGQSTLMDNMRYNDYTLWGGYGYNWVPVKNMLVAVSGTVGLAYKTQSGDNTHSWITQEDFMTALGFPTAPITTVKSHMVDFNFVGRGSVQYNNGRWFVGTRFVFNYFNYHRGDPTLRTDNSFWNWRLPKRKPT